MVSGFRAMGSGVIGFYKSSGNCQYCLGFGLLCFPRPAASARTQAQGRQPDVGSRFCSSTHGGSGWHRCPSLRTARLASRGGFSLMKMSANTCS